MDDFRGHLVFTAVRGAGGSGDIAVDDITITKGTCTSTDTGTMKRTFVIGGQLWYTIHLYICIFL